MKIFLIALGAFFFCLPVHAYDPVIIGEKVVLKSDILGEDRSYSVSLPDSYHDKTYSPQHYPVLYLLDGDMHFLTATGIINHMSNPKNNGNMRIPEMIVVAISTSKNRMRDLTPTNSLKDPSGKLVAGYSTSGGGAQFLKFLEKELIPEIDKKYRTRPLRTFVGHSLGGMTVLHSLLTQPGLFQNYIAIDSSLWWDGKIMNKWVKDFAPENKNTTARVFISTADHNASEGESSGFVAMTVSNRFFAEWLQKSPSPDFITKSQIFPNQDHASVPLLSLYYGLMFVFEDYKIPSEVFMGGHSEDLSRHYKSFSRQAGFRFLPPESLVDRLANIGPEAFEYTDKMVQNFLELNVENYPESAHAKKKLSEFLQRIKK